MTVDILETVTTSLSFGQRQAKSHFVLEQLPGLTSCGLRRLATDLGNVFLESSFGISMNTPSDFGK